MHMYTYIHIYICIYIHTHRTIPRGALRLSCKYVNMYTSIHVYMYAYVYIYTYAYTHTHTGQYQEALRDFQGAVTLNELHLYRRTVLNLERARTGRMCSLAIECVLCTLNELHLYRRTVLNLERARTGHCLRPPSPTLSPTDPVSRGLLTHARTRARAHTHTHTHTHRGGHGW